jgi:hypothetical protein
VRLPRQVAGSRPIATQLSSQGGAFRGPWLDRIDVRDQGTAHDAIRSSPCPSSMEPHLNFLTLPSHRRSAQCRPFFCSAHGSFPQVANGGGACPRTRPPPIPPPGRTVTRILFKLKIIIHQGRFGGRQWFSRGRCPDLGRSKRNGALAHAYRCLWAGT